jgi:hypothetical protein
LLVRRRTLVAGLVLTGLILTAAGAAVAAGMHHRLYRAMLYPVVARRMTASATSLDQALDQLNQFVYSDVGTPDHAPVVDDSAGDILIRGFGYCDQTDLVFTRLAAELGVNGRLLFLREADGTSPHSVAELYLDGHWRVYYTFFGFTPRRDDGSAATVGDLVRDPSLLEYSGGEAADWYRHGTPVQLVDSDGSSLGRLLDRLGEVVATQPWLADRLQDLYLRLPYPRYMDSDGQVFETYSSPDAQLYFRARNYQLFDRDARARATYQQIVSEYPGSQSADDALYQLGLLARDDDDQPGQVIATLEALQSNYPATHWKDEATYMEAEAYADANQCRPARTLFREIDDQSTRRSPGAAQWLDTMPCRPATARGAPA